MTTKEDDKKEKFNFWIYIGFIIIAFLFSLVIIGSLYYLFSNKTPPIPISSNVSASPNSNVSASPSPNSNVSASPNSNSNVSASASANNNSNYISSLFKKGGNYKKILKRF
jgi:cytoskeletal protein RodZ